MWSVGEDVWEAKGYWRHFYDFLDVVCLWVTVGFGYWVELYSTESKLVLRNN